MRAAIRAHGAVRRRAAPPYPQAPPLSVRAARALSAALLLIPITPTLPLCAAGMLWYHPALAVRYDASATPTQSLSAPAPDRHIAAERSATPLGTATDAPVAGTAPCPLTAPHPTSVLADTTPPGTPTDMPNGGTGNRGPATACTNAQDGDTTDRATDRLRTEHQPAGMRPFQVHVNNDVGDGQRGVTALDIRGSDTIGDVAAAFVARLGSSAQRSCR